VSDNRVIFMLKDGGMAWEIKDFLVKQDRCEEVTIEGKSYPGKVNYQKFLLSKTLEIHKYLKFVLYQQLFRFFDMLWNISIFYAQIVLRELSWYLFNGRNLVLRKAHFFMLP